MYIDSQGGGVAAMPKPQATTKGSGLDIGETKIAAKSTANGNGQAGQPTPKLKSPAHSAAATEGNDHGRASETDERLQRQRRAQKQRTYRERIKLKRQNEESDRARLKRENHRLEIENRAMKQSINELRRQIADLEHSARRFDLYHLSPAVFGVSQYPPYRVHVHPHSTPVYPEAYSTHRPRWSESSGLPASSEVPTNPFPTPPREQIGYGHRDYVVNGRQMRRHVFT